MATRKRSRSVVATGTAGPQGLRKGATQALRSGIVDQPEQKAARIIVGAERAPRITPQTRVGQGITGELFDSLGKFATGPAAKALREEWLGRLQADAEEAVLTGKSLDEVDDPNFIFEHYYRGALGQKRGADMLGRIAAEWETNANEPDYDYEASARAVLEDLEGMDDDTAANAVAIIKGRLGGMLNLERNRRQTKAQNDAVLVGQENITNLNLNEAKKDNYQAVFENMRAGRADLKLLPGYTDKRHNQWEYNEWVSYLKQNGPTDAWLEAVKQPFNGVEGGPSLWTNPQVGAKLRQQWESAVAGAKVIDAQLQGETMAAVRIQVDADEQMTEVLAQHLRDVGIGEPTIRGFWDRGSALKHARFVETVDFSNLLGKTPEEGTPAEIAAARNANLKQHRTALAFTAEEWNKRMARGRKELTDSGVADDKVNQYIAETEARYGRLSTHSKGLLQQGLNSTNAQQLEETYMLARTYATTNAPTWAQGLPDGTRQKYELLNIWTRQGLGFPDFILARKSMSEGMQAATVSMGATGAGVAIAEALEGEGLGIQFAARHKNLTRALLAMGRFDSVEDAAEAAAVELKAGVRSVGALGERFQIDASVIDERLGEQEFYNAYEGQALIWLEEKRRLDPAAISMDFGLVSAIDVDRRERFDFWPRRDGSTWVYHNDRLSFVIPTDEVLARTHALGIPRREVENRRAAEKQQADQAHANRERKLQASARAGEKKSGIRLLP